MKTKHLKITPVCGEQNSICLDATELETVINYLIGRTARYVTDKQVEKAFESAFKEWRRQ